MRRRSIRIVLAVAIALAAPWAATGEGATKPETVPAPLARTPLLQKLSADAELKQSLTEQIQALGGKPDAVLAGTSAARLGEDVKDLWHQGVLLTPRDSQMMQGGKLIGQLVVYNVFMHSLKDCLAGNFLPVATGPGPSPYAGAGLYDLPGAEDADHPYIAEVGFDLAGLKTEQIKLQVNHQPIPMVRLGNTGLLGFVRIGGGKHFVEITQPPPDPAVKTRRFWYTRLMRL